MQVTRNIWGKSGKRNIYSVFNKKKKFKKKFSIIIQVTHLAPVAFTTFPSWSFNPYPTTHILKIIWGDNNGMHVGESAQLDITRLERFLSENWGRLYTMQFLTPGGVGAYTWTRQEHKAIWTIKITSLGRQWCRCLHVY